jgi:hypothetical protein
MRCVLASPSASYITGINLPVMAEEHLACNRFVKLRWVYRRIKYLFAYHLRACNLFLSFDGCDHSNIGFNKSTEETASNRNQRDHREAAFRHQQIYYTKHAQCRMDCRQIDESEVKEILQDGEINYSKSDMKSKPCPKYAVEDYT